MDDVTRPLARISEIIESIGPKPLERHVEVEFSGQDVFLDGREFVRCTFIDCTLITELGVIAFEPPTRYSNCVFDFRGPAKMVMVYADKAREIVKDTGSRLN